MKPLGHGELDVRVNYIKVMQWVKETRYFLNKIEHHLDEAALKINGKRLERRIGVDRRKNEKERSNP